MQARGDIEVDAHHTVEDTALALGQALREALGDKAGICRFGDALVPLDETLVRVAVDLSGRPYVVHTEPDGLAPLIGTYDTTLTRHFFESLGAHGRDLRARRRAARPQPAPHRRSAVQGVRSRAPHRGRAGSAGGRLGTEYERRPVVHLGLAAVVVADYDEAIEFFIGALGFELAEDSPALTTHTGQPKRWVVVRPPGADTGLLLARADGAGRRPSSAGRQRPGRLLPERGRLPRQLPADDRGRGSFPDRAP